MRERLAELREWWRTLDWWGVRRARLWQGVICVGVVAVMALVLGLIVWAL